MSFGLILSKSLTLGMLWSSLFGKVIDLGDILTAYLGIQDRRPHRVQHREAKALTRKLQDRPRNSIERYPKYHSFTKLIAYLMNL